MIDIKAVDKNVMLVGHCGKFDLKFKVAKLPKKKMGFPVFITENLIFG